MQAKIADGVYLSQGNVRKLEQFSKGASQLAGAAGGNNFKPSPLILRFRVASAHLTSEKSFSRKKNSASAPQHRSAAAPSAAPAGCGREPN